MLLEPLEGVKQSPKYHPEGDALYHSLQVFELAREVWPYDEEFLLAALLHDVGKAIDPSDHVAAALQALEGSITERTEWLIAHHMEVQALRAGTLGVKARARIQQSEYLRRPDAFERARPPRPGAGRGRLRARGSTRDSPRAGGGRVRSLTRPRRRRAVQPTFLGRSGPAWPARTRPTCGARGDSLGGGVRSLGGAVGPCVVVEWPSTKGDEHQPAARRFDLSRPTTWSGR